VRLKFAVPNSETIKLVIESDGVCTEFDYEMMQILGECTYVLLVGNEVWSAVTATVEAVHDPTSQQQVFYVLFSKLLTWMYYILQLLF